MRTHPMASIAIGAAALAAFVALLVPSRAAAWHPRHNNGLTIAATPDPITAGQGVLIYGQLKAPDNAYRRVWLFHRINPAARFTLIGVRRTDAHGFYEFVRPDGVVRSNRNWFVTGPYGTHSRTIHELASAVVTLDGNTTTATTADPVTLTGTVYPAHPHERVLIQKQDSVAGDGWHTLASTRTDGNSAFAVTQRFRSAGSYTLRAYFPGDPRNVPGQSPSVTLTVQQQQNPSFTINGSAAVITNGQTETVSGTLYAGGSTTTPQANVPVTLYGRDLHGDLKALAGTTTDASGNYTFTQMPLRNTVYRVETTGGDDKTAALYVGVQDVVTAALSSSTVAVGGAVTVTGTVTPDHTGHAIYLQEQNAAGDWAVSRAGTVSAGSMYSFTYTPGQTGTFQFRVQITGGPVNIGGVSSPMTLTVSGLEPVSSLPPAS